MPKNSPPDYVVQHQARQRQHVDRLLCYVRQVAERFEIELPGLETASEEFQSKRMWCDGWGAMGRGMEGILQTADRLAETDPTAAGYLLHHIVTVVNGMVVADNYTQSAHTRQMREMIPAIQSETRADQGRAASRAKAEQRQNGPIKRRRDLVVALVSPLPDHQRRQTAGRVALLICDQLNAALADHDEKASVSTVRDDIIQLNLI